MRHRPIPPRWPAPLLLAATLALSGCAGSVTPPAEAPLLPRYTPPPARVLSAPGLEGVIGASAAELIHQFGPPRLDVGEGDARKLQFGGAGCLLDVYLYPPTPRAEPRATYLDARRGDGRDVDRAACVALLRRR